MFFRLIIAVTAYTIMMTGGTADSINGFDDLISETANQQSFQNGEGRTVLENGTFSELHVEENKEIELDSDETYEIN